ncbi:hypothetical protein HHI36_012893 [Cryptolaemus montrouzieri]|uniref:Uncharacterized protein n=1 Tax=Cryptolaemus montrouzieri TaxID=559131 RepID=A0ABD2NGD4_9CUCU
MILLVVMATTSSFSLLIPDSSEVQYKTKAASEKHHDLWCYKCDTMIDGENCLDLHGNFSNMNMKCNKEQKKCQVDLNFKIHPEQFDVDLHNQLLA